MPDFPPFTITKKYFDQQFCKCLRYREAGKCDCKLCAYIKWNTAAFHNARGKWDVAERCEEGTCSACTPTSAYREASRSPEHMMAFLLCPRCRPCDIQENGFPPRAPAASAAGTVPVTNPTSVTPTANYNSAGAAALAPLLVANATAVAAAKVVRIGRSRESTRERKPTSDPPPLNFPSAATPTAAAAAPAAKRWRQSDAQDIPGAPADADALHRSAGAAANPPPDSPVPEVLMMRGADKPFTVYAPTCANGTHQSYFVGRFVTLFLTKNYFDWVNIIHWLPFSSVLGELRSTAVGA